MSLTSQEVYCACIRRRSKFLTPVWMKIGAVSLGSKFSLKQQLSAFFLQPSCFPILTHRRKFQFLTSRKHFFREKVLLVQFKKKKLYEKFSWITNSASISLKKFSNSQCWAHTWKSIKSLAKSSHINHSKVELKTAIKNIIFVSWHKRSRQQTCNEKPCQKKLDLI